MFLTAIKQTKAFVTNNNNLKQDKVPVTCHFKLLSLKNQAKVNNDHLPYYLKQMTVQKEEK